MRSKRQLDMGTLPETMAETDSGGDPLEQLRRDRIFFDGVTGLPIHPFETPERIDERIEHLGVIYLQVGKFFGFEELFGWEHYDRVLAAVSAGPAGRRARVAPLAPSSTRFASPAPTASSSSTTCRRPGRAGSRRASRRRRRGCARAWAGGSARPSRRRPPTSSRSSARASTATDNARVRPSRHVVRTLQEAVKIVAQRQTSEKAELFAGLKGVIGKRQLRAGLPARAAPAGRRHHGLRGAHPRAPGDEPRGAHDALRDRARERDGRRARDALPRDHLREPAAGRRRAPAVRQRVRHAAAPPDLPGRAQPRRDQPQPRRRRRRDLREGDGPGLRGVPGRPAAGAASQDEDRDRRRGLGLLGPRDDPPSEARLHQGRRLARAQHPQRPDQARDHHEPRRDRRTASAPSSSRRASRWRPSGRRWSTSTWPSGRATCSGNRPSRSAPGRTELPFLPRAVGAARAPAPYLAAAAGAAFSNSTARGLRPRRERRWRLSIRM